MASRKRFIWAWWLGGIVLGFGVLGFVDFKYAIPFLFQKAIAGKLTPGSIGTISDAAAPCFPTSSDIDAYASALRARNHSIARSALDKAVMLETGTRAKGLDIGGYLNQDLLIHVLDGTYQGNDCWISLATAFDDVALA